MVSSEEVEEEITSQEVEVTQAQQESSPQMQADIAFARLLQQAKETQSRIQKLPKQETVKEEDQKTQESESLPKEETKETETVSPEPVEEDFVSEIEEAESSIQKEIAAAQKFEKELDVLQKKMAQNVQDLQEEKNEAEKTKVFDKADLDQIQQVEANPSSEDTESAEESEQEEADIETDVETDAEINNDIETDIAYDTEESENVDSEEAETFFEEEEEDEDDEEWETSADNFVASLLKTGAKLTNTSEPVIREEEETPSETVESESENQNIEDESVETDSSKAFSEETESSENESAEAEPSKDDSAEIDEEESLEESEDESLTDEVADYIENSDNSDDSYDEDSDDAVDSYDDNSDDAADLEEDSKEEAASDLVEESLSDEYSQDEYSEDDYQKEDDSFEDENDSKTENQNESLVKSMPRATLVDDSVYEYEKAIIDDLKQEDVSRYVDVDEETYEEVKKKKHHVVPIVLLVLVSSIALAAAILAATGHLGEFVNALNEQFSSGNQPDADESAKLPEKSSDKALEENTEKEHSSEVKSSETQTSYETAPSSSADDNSENNNENNQTSQNTAADTAAVSDSAEITSSAGSTEPSSLKEESSTPEKSVDEAETESESEIESQTESESETETESDSETETEIEKESQTQTESETETKTASTEQEKTSLEQTETSTQDVENKTESESESERETETESQTESESEVETETESEVESEMETEAESESEEDNTNPYHEAAKAKYPTFSNESYTPIPDVSSGCIYAKYTNFDEAFQTLYTNQSDLSGAAQVALNTPGFNIIGYRVYMLAYQDGILNAYSTQLDGTDLQLSAANVGTEAYIMNGSIFSENREYSMTGDPVGTAYPYIKRFLTFGEDKVYYLDTDGDITRSDYQHTAIQRLELGIDDGNDVAWAQVMGPYLIYYDTKTELMYSCNLDVGTIVLLDFDGVSDPSGLCGNGNWVYGLYDGKLAKVRPNGSELQTIYEPDDSLELVSVEHAMENYIILTAKNTANIKTSAENNSADSNAGIKTYCYNLQTGELTQLSAE